MASISMAPNQRMYQTSADHKNNESSSMTPTGLDGNVVFSKATTPNMLNKQKNPNHIFINNSGSYHFAYESSASLGDAVHTGYTLGMVVDKNNGLPIRLDIQPCAWSASYGVTDAAGGSQKNW